MAEAAAGPRFTLFQHLPKELRLLIWRAALPGPRVVHIRQRPLDETIEEWEMMTGKEWPEMMGALTDPRSDENIETGDEDGYSNDGRSESSPPGALHNNSIIQNNPLLANEVEQNRNGIRAEMGEAINAYQNDLEGYKDAQMIGIYSESCAPNILYVCREARDVVLESYTPAFRCTGSFPQTYFDFSIDTLYLRYDTFSYYWSREALQSIALDLEYRARIEDIENLRKVQRLAILIEQPHDFNWPTVDLASIFGTFGGVKEFFAVLQHFDDAESMRRFVTGDENPVDQMDLMMIEPVNVEMVLASGSTSPSLSSRSDILDAQNRIRGIRPSDYESWIDMEKIEEYMNADCAEGEHPWDMPVFKQKVMVPRRLKEELDAARKILN
jgi:hypothetical protein